MMRYRTPGRPLFLRLVLMTVLIAETAFQFIQPAAGQASADAYETIKRLGAAMERCWFAPGDSAFAEYAYSPEPNATDAPRILIVPRKSPDARPALVIELRGRDLNAYGPLATSPYAQRIAADLRRWLGGDGGCG